MNGALHELVRCLACRYEYRLPPRGIKCACPRCGAVTWMSARISPGPGEAEPPAQALEM